MTLKLCMDHRSLKFYKVYINDYPELTLTFLRQGQNRSKLFLIIPDPMSGECLLDHWSSGYKSITLSLPKRLHIKLGF